MLTAKRCFVSGRVQGVFYRASAQKQAIALGISGFARNLPDGRVEVLAIGDALAVEALVEWLWRGPPAASVTGVESSDVPPDQVADAPKRFSTA